MKKSDSKKKLWTKPEVHILNIRKDTFGGGSYGNENVKGKSKIPTP